MAEQVFPGAKTSVEDSKRDLNINIETEQLKKKQLTPTKYVHSVLHIAKL